MKVNMAHWLCLDALSFIIRSNYLFCCYVSYWGGAYQVIKNDVQRISINCTKELHLYTNHAIHVRISLYLLYK